MITNSRQGTPVLTGKAFPARKLLTGQVFTYKIRFPLKNHFYHAVSCEMDQMLRIVCW
jgi:hypothetical protein